MLVSELKKIPLFAHFPRAALTTLSRLVQIKDYDDARIIFRENTTRDRLYIVLKGRVVVEKEVLRQQVELAVFKPFDVLRETIFYSPGGRHQHTGKSFAAHTRLLELSLYNILKLFRAHPTTVPLVHRYLIEVMSQRLARTNDKLLTIFAMSKLALNFKNKNHLAELLIDHLIQLFKVKRGALVMFDTTGRRLLIEYTSGYGRTKIPRVIPLEADLVATRALNEKQSIIITPADWQKHFGNASYASKHMLITPIRTKREIIGALILAEKNNRRHFTLNNQILLEAIAEQIAPSLTDLERETVEKHSRQLHNVYIDPFYS